MSLLTGFEITGNWSTLAEEAAYMAAIDAEYPSVSTWAEGNSVDGNPMWAARIGNGPVRCGLLIYGGQHGNEPGPREAASIFIKQLATTTDPVVLEFLSRHPVVVMPNCNPDTCAKGTSNGARNNRNGININRDHMVLSQPEGRAIARLWKRFRPYLVIDAHETEFRNQDFFAILVRQPTTTQVHVDVRTVSEFICGTAAAAAADVVSPWQWGWYTPLTLPSTLLTNSGQKNACAVILEIEGLGNFTNPPRQARVDISLAFYWEMLNRVISSESVVKNACRTADNEQYARGMAGTSMILGSTTVPTPFYGYELSAQAVQDSAHIRDLLAIDISEKQITSTVTRAQAIGRLVPYAFDEVSSHKVVTGARVTSAPINKSLTRRRAAAGGWELRLPRSANDMPVNRLSASGGVWN